MRLSLRAKRCGVREQRITARKMEQVKEGGGGGEGRKEGFLPSPFPSPPPSFIFVSRPIFCAGKTPKIPFLIFLCSQTPQKRLLRRLHASIKAGLHQLPFQLVTFSYCRHLPRYCHFRDPIRAGDGGGLRGRCFSTMRIF